MFSDSSFASNAPTFPAPVSWQSFDTAGAYVAFMHDPSRVTRISWRKVRRDQHRGWTSHSWLEADLLDGRRFRLERFADWGLTETIFEPGPRTDDSIIWDNLIASSHEFVRPLTVDELRRIGEEAANAQPYSLTESNCHHFVRDVWNTVVIDLLRRTHYPDRMKTNVLWGASESFGRLLFGGFSLASVGSVASRPPNVDGDGGVGGVQGGLGRTASFGSQTFASRLGSSPTHAQSPNTSRYRNDFPLALEGADEAEGEGESRKNGNYHGNDDDDDDDDERGETIGIDLDEDAVVRGSSCSSLNNFGSKNGRRRGEGGGGGGGGEGGSAQSRTPSNSFAGSAPAASSSSSGARARRGSNEGSELAAAGDAHKHEEDEGGMMKRGQHHHQSSSSTAKPNDISERNNNDSNNNNDNDNNDNVHQIHSIFDGDDDSSLRRIGFSTQRSRCEIMDVSPSVARVSARREDPERLSGEMLAVVRQLDDATLDKNFTALVTAGSIQLLEAGGPLVETDLSTAPLPSRAAWADIWQPGRRSEALRLASLVASTDVVDVLQRILPSLNVPEPSTPSPSSSFTAPASQQQQSQVGKRFSSLVSRSDITGSQHRVAISANYVMLMGDQARLAIYAILRPPLRKPGPTKKVRLISGDAFAKKESHFVYTITALPERENTLYLRPADLVEEELNELRAAVLTNDWGLVTLL